MTDDGIWRLAPAYDVTFTVNYKNRFIGDRHAMLIGNADKLVSRDQLLRLADENDVRNADIIISQVINALRSFKQKAEEVSVNSIFIDIISDYITNQIDRLK